jgi:hypothetical protein
MKPSDRNDPGTYGKENPGKWATIQMIKYGVLVLLAGFFLLFGVHLLLASYGLSDPFSFVMTFFASNLIILISAVGVVGFVIRMVHSYRDREKN